MSSKERPIIFSGPMIKKIREGKKTQTRRVIWPQPELVDGDPDNFEWCSPRSGCVAAESPEELAAISPYGVPGDRLWVRETWGLANTCPGGDFFCKPDWVQIGYKARIDPEGISDPIPRPAAEVEGYHSELIAEMQAAGVEGDSFPRVLKWRSPRFMPRWASRLLLEITSVRVEQLQVITVSDAAAEGVDPRAAPSNDEGWSYLEAFKRAWDKLNGRRAPWGSNPWVWVVSFKLLEGVPHA
jgi:hypothetical protein